MLQHGALAPRAPHLRSRRTAWSSHAACVGNRPGCRAQRHGKAWQQPPRRRTASQMISRHRAGSTPRPQAAATSSSSSPTWGKRCRGAHAVRIAKAGGVLRGPPAAPPRRAAAPAGHPVLQAPRPRSLAGPANSTGTAQSVQSLPGAPDKRRAQPRASSPAPAGCWPCRPCPAWRRRAGRSVEALVSAWEGAAHVHGVMFSVLSVREASAPGLQSVQL